MKAILVLALVCALAIGQTSFVTPITNTISITQTEWYFTQTLDHLHPQNNATIDSTNWKQRFCVFSQYWNPLNGAVFISIGGESRMKGISQGRGWLVQLAQKYNALVISLEHRFYGNSQPFPTPNTDSFSTNNLKYLTHDQALADTAYFISQVKLNNFADNSFKVSAMNAFITVGGSYPGALSAWFRYKYPHLVVGALASSAVVNAFKDFWQYDNQIYLSAKSSAQGIQCPQNIQSFLSEIQKEINGPNSAALLTAFGADKPQLTINEFLFYIPDQIASLVQYGKTSTLCTLFSATDYATQKKNFIGYLTNTGQLDGSGYAQATLNDPSFTAETQNARQWLYQYCSYFGWLQTPSQVEGQQMRASTNSLGFFQSQCLQAFGDIYLPHPDQTVNPFYGGLNLQASNIIFTNGSEDPWQWASLTKSNNPKITAIVTTCQDCGHGVELGYPTSDDATNPINVTRAAITAQFTQWINEFNSQFNFVQSKIKGQNSQ